MILSDKLKEVRKRFGLSQEQLAEIMGISRQAVAKWENGGGIPDISNLQLLAKTFGVTIDYLLDTKTTLPALTLRVEIDPQKYGHKKLSIRKRYKRIMQEYYPEPWAVYPLMRERKFSKFASILGFLISPGIFNLADAASNMSPYLLATKDALKLLVHIDGWNLTALELPSDTNPDKFAYNHNKFTRIKRNLNA